MFFLSLYFQFPQSYKYLYVIIINKGEINAKMIVLITIVIISSITVALMYYVLID